MKTAAVESKKAHDNTQIHYKKELSPTALRMRKKEKSIKDCERNLASLKKSSIIFFQSGLRRARAASVGPGSAADRRAGHPAGADEARASGTVTQLRPGRPARPLAGGPAGHLPGWRGLAALTVFFKSVFSPLAPCEPERLRVFRSLPVSIVTE